MMKRLSRSSPDTRTSELIRRARDDPEAFAALFDRHAVALRQWLYAQTGDAGIANEMLAETFAAAWRGVRRFRGETEGSGEAWLYGIARNLVRQHRRRGRIETTARRRLAMSVSAADDGGIDAAVGRIDAAALSPIVRAAFDDLSLEQQRAIGYRVIGDLSYEELGTRLGCDPVTARTRVHRGLRAMRDVIEKGERK
jgi:RNA polymerase sigma factor (sigma-70 family)